MLEKSTTSQPQPVPNPGFDPIPDPWETPSPTEVKLPVWHIAPETHPLIPAATAPEALIPPEGNPSALRLPPPATQPGFKSAQVLVWDELKIRASNSPLGRQIQNALTLLCWMETARGSGPA